MPSTTKNWDLGVTSWCSCTSRGLQGNNIGKSGKMLVKFSWMLNLFAGQC
jgi:hypothetical protein